MTPALTLNPVNIDVIENELVLSTLIVAEQITDGEITQEKIIKNNRSIRDMIKKNLSDFEEFGKVRFQNAPSINSKTNQTIVYAELNEEQYFLLMTFQRNTKKVRRFKINATKAFFAMKEKLYGSANTSPELIAFNSSAQRQFNAMHKHISSLTKEIGTIKDQFVHDAVERAEIHVMLSQNTIATGRLAHALENQPMDSAQILRVRTEAEERGRELSDIHGIRAEITIGAVFKEINRLYSVKTYTQLEREDYESVLYTIKTFRM